MAQMVKNLPAMQKKHVWFLGPEDPLEKGMATHSSILAWRIPRTEEPGRLQSMGSKRDRYDWMANIFTSVQFSCSVVSDCNPMNRSMPGLPVHNQLPEFTQTCIHWVSDAIQPSHPLLPPSPPALNPSQHQSLFQWVNSSALASFLPKKSQGWSPSEWTGWISLQSKGLSRVFSNTTVQKHQFFGAQPSSQFNSHIHTWPQEKP